MLPPMQTTSDSSLLVTFAGPLNVLLMLVCASWLLGLTAGALAMLIRVGSSSLPWLKRMWTWSANGKPISCSACMSAHCNSLLVIGGILPAAYVFSDARILWALAAVPAATVIAAVVQRWALPDELVLPEVPTDGLPKPSADALPPGAFRVGELNEAWAKLDAAYEEMRHEEIRIGCDCPRCSWSRWRRQGKKGPDGP